VNSAQLLRTERKRAICARTLRSLSQTSSVPARSFVGPFRVRLPMERVRRREARDDRTGQEMSPSLPPLPMGGERRLSTAPQRDGSARSAARYGCSHGHGNFHVESNQAPSEGAEPKSRFNTCERMFRARPEGCLCERTDSPVLKHLCGAKC